MRFSKQTLFLGISVFIFAAAVFLQIAKNKVKTFPILYGDELVITLDNTIPPGDYDLYYYVATSASDRSTPALSFSLQSGTEYFETQSYTESVGFATSSFTKTESEAITATFHHIAQKKHAATYAAVGDVFVKSKDGNFEKQLYSPSSWGNNARDIAFANRYEPLQNQSFDLSSFADIMSLSITNSTLDFTFLCKEDVSEKYRLVLKISSDVNRIRQNGVRYASLALVEDEVWVKGKEYERSIDLPLPPGDYNIDIAILPPDIKYTSVYLSDDKKLNPYGSIAIKGQSLSDFLTRIQHNQIAILSIKDEGTYTLSQISLQALSSIGLQADLIGKYRWSYAAVIAKGVDGFVPFENLSQEQIHITFPKGSLFGSYALPFRLDLESAGYDVGNASHIVINEKDYSTNSRGINIVIYDLTESSVADSACFDTHSRNFRYLP